MACCPKSIIADILKAKGAKTRAVLSTFITLPAAVLTLACIRVNTFLESESKES